MSLHKATYMPFHLDLPPGESGSGRQLLGRSWGFSAGLIDRSDCTREHQTRDVLLFVDSSVSALSCIVEDASISKGRHDNL
jgi:hypothetical protein